VTGVPVRADFFQLPPRDLKALPSLLVFGGSQGARSINRVMREALPALRERIPSLQIMHQTGERDFEETRAAYAAAGAAAEVLPFIDGMSAAFARADVVLCRSGASTVAEITAAGKPAIFVPFPHAADDHQRRNAEALQQVGAAVMLEEKDLSAEKLVPLLEELLTDRVRLQRMAEAARLLAHPDAAREIAGLAAQLAGAVVA
jgi:UDP-N-acetylglucosamine--N-acetylmuramyl-(pentapeptide) pyrophosphoryl-undecaprenol N-acetylglucosamine transferase